MNQIFAIRDMCKLILEQLPYNAAISLGCCTKSSSKVFVDTLTEWETTDLAVSLVDKPNRSLIDHFMSIVSNQLSKYLHDIDYSESYTTKNALLFDTFNMFSKYRELMFIKSKSHVLLRQVVLDKYDEVVSSPNIDGAFEPKYASFYIWLLNLS